MTRVFRLAVFAAAISVVQLCFHVPVCAQKPQSTKPRQDFTLRVSNKDQISLSLKAEQSPLPAIATQLSKSLKIPVILGASAQKWEVTTAFKGMLLEPALNMIAPRAYIDYEMNQSPGAAPRPVGIYLNGHDDPEPPITAVVKGQSEAILFEGNTEDTPETVAEPEPIKVSYDHAMLTVKARRQPLTVVAYRIAEQLGVPLDLRWESPDIVDIDFSDLPLEDALGRVSPHVRLFVRADLQKVERRPLRMLLVRPVEKSPSS
jgi:hypothetical protein